MEFRSDKGVRLDEYGNVVKWENQAMSDVIKPEDIPEEIGRTAWRIAATSDKSGRRHLVAEILNAAIEAGIVSPPCWVMRFNGGLQRDANGEPTVWPSRGLDSPDGAIIYEHWKGQTE